VSVALSLHEAPLPTLWGLPLPPPGFVASGMDWAPLDPDGGPPPTVRGVIVAAALRLGRLAYLGDPPSTRALRWKSPGPKIEVTDDPAIAQGLFDSAASWGQQGQAVAVFTPGTAPDAAVLAQAAPARGGDLAALCESTSVLLVLLPAVDGAAIGSYARSNCAIEWDVALAACARSAGVLFSRWDVRESASK